MMIARWSIDARFGHKQEAIALMHRWWREIAPEIGWSDDQARIVAGSLGAPESRIEVEVRVADLAAIDEAWGRLGRLDSQGAWAAALAPHVVSGTGRWTVFREV